MINLEGLPVGTKLIWDAPEPFEGYAKNSKHPNRVFYPATVIGQDPKKKHTLIKTSEHSNNWMGYDSEYLRLPTKEELKDEVWR